MTARRPAYPIDIEFALLDTLHYALSSMLMGNLTATVAIFAAAWVNDNRTLLGLATCMLVGALMRSGVTFFYHRKRVRDADSLRAWKARTAASAAFFSAALGLSGWIVVRSCNDQSIVTMLVGLTVAYAVTSAARNTGYPLVALIQVVFSSLPINFALVMRGGAMDLTVGILMTFYMLSLRELSTSIHNTLLNALLFGREKQALAEEKAALAEEISEQASQFDTALTNMSHGLAMFDALGKLVICNHRFAELFNLAGRRGAKGASPRRVIMSASYAGFIDANCAEAVAERFAAHIRIKAQDDMRLDFLDGRSFELSFQAMARGGSVVIVDDITERCAQDARIAHMARFDRLTNLPNRAQFEERFEETWAHSQRSGQPFAVVCIDLDHFKEVNDTLTHLVGDQLLIAVAERMRDSVRATDHLSRFGGDEFMLILTDLDPDKPEDDIASALQHLNEIVSAPYEIESHKIVIGMSAGVALAPADGRGRDELFRAADLALYKAKAQGRGDFCFFEPSLDAHAQEKRQIMLDMRAGVAKGEFRLEYQPIVDLSTGRISACEALMRWDHPTRKMTADKFIPVAEDTGMIIELGQWAIYQACRDAAAWPEPATVAVNLSPVQFKREDLVETIRSALNATGLPAERLELEITESLLISGDETTAKLVEGIIALGCSLSLDDFGTGYSTFGYLIRYPFKKVKLDKGFIDHVVTQETHRAILRAVCQMARDMGIAIVAEGVETQQQLEILDAEQVRFAQGWYFAPSLADALIPWKRFKGGLKRVWRAA